MTRLRLLAAAALAAALALPAAAQQTGGMAGHKPGGTSGGMPMMGMHGHGKPGAAAPQQAGQDAFGAIQEIVRLLEADPATDWSTVDMAALREHLIDMNRVMLDATAAETRVPGGLQVDVTGSGRTLVAIRRMLPAHAGEIDKLNGWVAKADEIADGVRLTVTASDAKEVAHIQGLGFAGLLVSGGHHQPHHLLMAKGAHPVPGAGSPGGHGQHKH